MAGSKRRVREASPLERPRDLPQGLIEGDLGRTF